MSSLIALTGFVILIGGMACALLAVGIAPFYVIVASVNFLGLAILTAVARPRRKIVQ